MDSGIQGSWNGMEWFHFHIFLWNGMEWNGMDLYFFDMSNYNAGAYSVEFLS
jgi:hypothetical protein